MNEYLVIDSSGYLCTNNLHALNAVGLDASREAGWCLVEQVFRGVQCKTRMEYNNNSGNTSIPPITLNKIINGAR